jgi:hypothetical protein
MLISFELRLRTCVTTSATALLALGIAFVLFSASSARAQSVPNVNVTKAAGNQYETAVAINPIDNNQIFVVARNEVGGLFSARTNDGGATWIHQLIATSTVPPPGALPRAYGNASVAWDDFGNLFIVYLSQSSPNLPPLYVTLAVSTDAGATFYAPTGIGAAIILPRGTAPFLQGDQPTVAVGPGSAGFPGSVWVTYFSAAGIWVSGAGVSGLGALGTFTSQLLPGQPAGVNFGDIAVGPNGEVVVTYGPDAGGWGNFMIYTHVDPDGLGPSPFSNAAAAVPTHVSGFLSIPAQPSWGIDPEAGLAIDKSTGTHRGRVFLVYTDTDSVVQEDTNIFVVHSDDMTATWSAPVRVNDDDGPASQFLPRMSLDTKSGAIAVAWFDARNSAANNTVQYFGAISSDSGMTFSRNFQISVGMSDQAKSVPALRDADFGDYTGGAFANGRLVAAWADNSNSTFDNPDGASQFDVYTAIVDVAPIDTTPPVVSTTTQTPVLWPPNDQLIDLTIGGTITDDLSGVDARTAMFNVSDEYGIVQPQGLVNVDASGAYSLTVPLQASRHGDDRDGRLYVITVSARDNAGNAGSAHVTVVVPHDER